MHIAAETLDDLMREALDYLFKSGQAIRPEKGDAVEVIGTLLELTNPRARLSRSESRGKVFSCIGELCWYLAGSNSLEFIEYYLPRYAQAADGEIIFGGYGPRLFGMRGHDQIANIVALLRAHSVSRKAVIQLFDAGDLAARHNDIPCTCSLQFLIRSGRLHLVTFMRSNDWFFGLPHDVFAFTMLQEIVARDLGVDVGVYKHAVGSLHLYDCNREAASM